VVTDFQAMETNFLNAALVLDYFAGKYIGRLTQV